MFHPNLVCMLHHSVAVLTVSPVKVVNVYYPVAVDDMIMSVVNDYTWTVNVPGALTPGAPPGGIIMPVVRRNIHDVLGFHKIPDGIPVINVDITAIIRMVASPAIGVTFDGFNDDFFPIEVFIAYNLEDGLSTANNINFNNSYVLDVISVQYGLHDNGVEVAPPLMLDADVIDPAVIVQIQVVDPILFCIEFSFKIPEGVRLFEEVECPFEAEVIAFVT